VGETVSLLPAFGGFTGGFAIEKTPDTQIYVVGDGAVWAAG